DFPHDLEGGTTWSAHVENADETGKFHLQHVPVCTGARLQVYLEGFDGAELPVPEHSGSDLRIVLHPHVAARTIRGLVLDAGGDVAGGATVRFGALATLSDSSGRFEIVVPKNSSYEDSALIA